MLTAGGLERMPPIRRRASPHPRLAAGRGSLAHWQPPQSGAPDDRQVQAEVAVDCGWGTLVFAQTYTDAAAVARDLVAESRGRRNIALYVRDPHVVLAQQPQYLFLDPSHSFRWWLAQAQLQRPRRRLPFTIRRLRTRADTEAMHRIYRVRGMVPAPADFVWEARGSRVLSYFLAEDDSSGRIIGTVMGVDHVEGFGDPEQGASLWCLAVDPQAEAPGVGEALVRTLAAHYQARGRVFMDLSVMHDNVQAIGLYEKMGFVRVPVFALKCKNAINESLFMPEPAERGLNPYAQIVADEALRRGIRVEVLDAAEGYLRLTHGARSVVCRESLSELTSAIAMSRCQDKRVTSRLLAEAGLAVPEQRVADGSDEDVAFLRRHRAVVVKPADGEQGAGISVDLRGVRELRAAIKRARAVDATVLIERYCPGEDLRVVVIGFEVVAAALRKPPEIVGDGQHTVAELIEKLSRRRQAATQGESRIPLDAETERCVRQAGHRFESVLPVGERLRVRKTANLHTGGQLIDVTDQLSSTLRQAAERAARVLEIPVTGLDFLVPEVTGNDYVIVEANERPGLANHEPQPTAARYLDLLFPLTRPQEALRAKTPD
jgi:GNAT-family acetyltransferase (TIGR03103 family)